MLPSGSVGRKKRLAGGKKRSMSDNIGLTDEQTREENLKRLADIHLFRYRGMLRRALVGDPGLRAGELKHLVAIWEGVELKKYRWEFLAPEERNEVYDAVMSGE